MSIRVLCVLCRSEGRGEIQTGACFQAKVEKSARDVPASFCISIHLFPGAILMHLTCMHHSAICMSNTSELAFSLRLIQMLAIWQLRFPLLRV